MHRGMEHSDFYLPSLELVYFVLPLSPHKAPEWTSRLQSVAVQSHEI
jgi:hypothetical protein